MKKMNNLSCQTIENICQYLKKTGCRAYTKQAGSSEGVVWERDEYVANARLTDLTHDGPIDYVLLEVFPGITADKPFRPMVSAYCQENIVPELGAIEVSGEHGDVYYKVELPIRENALSEDTMAIVEEHIAKELAKHRETLDALAHGYLPDEMPAKGVEEKYMVVSPDMTERMQDAINGIRGYLMESNHNVIAESVNEDGLPSWMVEIYTGDEHYYLDIDATPKGVATVKLKYGPKGILVDKPYRRMTANVLTKESSIRKVGYLWVGTDVEGMCAVSNISLLDGPVSKETMELLEGILVKFLGSMREKVEMLSHGIIPEEERGERRSRLSGLLDAMRHAPGFPGEDDDDDDDETESEDGDEEFDFASFLASLGTPGGEG